MDIQLFEENKVEEQIEGFEEESNLEVKKENIEEAKVEIKTESFELNKKNLTLFRHLLRKAKKWIKQEKIRVQGLEKESWEDSPFWKPRLQAHDESLKNAKDELYEARIVQEKLLAKAYSILIEQGRISERQPCTTEELEWEGQEFKDLRHKPESIDNTTRNLIFQLIS